MYRSSGVAVYTFGWFSTGRDEAARRLLMEAWESMKNGAIPARLGYVFCSREVGDAPESDRFIQTVKDLGVPLYCLSSRRWNSEQRQKDREAWRDGFHQRIMEMLRGEETDAVVLAGYMLIVSPEMCQEYALINLHPAAPGGPKGTWQEVIWELIAQGAEETGIMVHRVTETLDEGPPITYCTFPLKGDRLDPLWVEMGAKVGFMPLGEIIQEEGERNALFREIRHQGVIREIPLLLLTMKALAERRISIRGQKILDHKGVQTGSLCLNREVEAYITRKGQPES